MSTLQVHIVSAEREMFSGTAMRVVATAALGEICIYPRHAPLLASLKPGQVRVVSESEQEDVFYISGGMLEVQPTCVTVLADTALRAHDLDEAAALQAKKKAEQLLTTQHTDIEYAHARAELANAMAQLEAIERLRRKRK